MDFEWVQVIRDLRKMHFGFFQWVAMGSCMPKRKQVGKIEKMVQRVSCKDKFFPILVGRLDPVWLSWVLHASPQSAKGPRIGVSRDGDLRGGPR